MVDITKYDTHLYFKNEYLFNAIDGYFSIIDSVKWFQYGEEPLLHKNLEKFTTIHCSHCNSGKDS